MKSLNKFVNGLYPILLSRLAVKEQGLKMQNRSLEFTFGFYFNAKLFLWINYIFRWE